MLNDKGIQAINKLLLEDAEPNSNNVNLYRSLLEKVAERKDAAALVQTATSIASVIAADAVSQIVMSCYKDAKDGLEVGASGQDQPEYRMLELLTAHMTINCISHRLSMMDQEQIPDLLQVVRNEIISNLEKFLDSYA